MITTVTGYNTELNPLPNFSCQLEVYTSSFDTVNYISRSPQARNIELLSSKPIFQHLHAHFYTAALYQKGIRLYTLIILLIMLMQMLLHYTLYNSPLRITDRVGSDASHEFNGLFFRHLLDGNFALSNSIDEHGSTGTCCHVGTLQQIDLHTCNLSLIHI